MLAIFAAGVAAGTINTIVGSGSLITFPTLLAFGFPPVTANVSNNIGLVPGGVSGTWGYRRELSGQGRLVRALAPMSLLGSVAGALLLLRLPAAAFKAIVPVLLAIAIVLVLLQPRMQARVAARHADPERSQPWWNRALLMGGTFGAGAYGGYFGAAQGVLLMGLLGSLVPEDLQRLNAVKNLLALIVNTVAAVTFLLVAREHIDVAIVLLIAAGSLLGGVLGSRYGRRLPPRALRAVIVGVGVVAIVKVVTTG
ncbi:sulfite exporter TauE/SafE family protein [Angustibacter sp. McL0619]|uniref:sulfite exporter TauE/SafE family protein n=1 Tax=Angustibacter sp. McL0619 TaxID=3415676 RepID=UPI003CF5947B